ncbi:alpha/beta hydrolase family protein [Candidatus Uabimicrobium amorphum]|uniref:Acyl-peptide hydrolase n=1 Tax=Uabimicrobium amorphum TaxID=2596890 RepID=A0A5S9IP00_UABAM|nr:S9 family peptidase [Candidatus Uabimicrobium amorphum]BBM85244.1 peptidase S9 [Candidatus Uabimicrobium amorphum]
MKKILLLLWIFCITSLYCEHERYTIEQFLSTTSISGSSFSPDEKEILFSSDASGVYNAYVMSVKDGKARQITHSTKESIYILSFFPKDKRILYRSDQGGNELHHIYLLDEDGKSRDLTPGEKVRSGFYGWSHDRKSFFYGSNKRDPRYMDVYEMDIDTFEAKMLYKNEGGYYPSGISNNKKYIALAKVITRNNSDMYLYNCDEKKIHHLSPHKGDINFSPVTFSVDNTKLYYLTDRDSEFSYLMSYDLKTTKSSIVEQTNWDIMYAYFSYSGKYMVLGINNDSRTEVKIYNTVAKKWLKLPEMPHADITSVNISSSENLMTFYVNSSRSPNNLYVYNFTTGKYRQLTNTMNSQINVEHLVDGNVIRYKSFDDLEVPAILYKPHQASATNKVPAIVWVHGGPGGQSRIRYSALIQYLANHGYAVLAVNNRGSSGYGKTFFQLDDHNHGKGDLGDCIAAKKFLADTGYVDAKKIAIVGGSYGGYMVLAALAFRPTEFQVGVNIFGVSNWVRTLKSIPAWWEAYREALYRELGNPHTEEEYLRSISPLFHSDKIMRPLLVLQGANDPRVLKVESDEIVAAVKKKGVPVEYIVFPDEGHGFAKKQNRIKGFKAIRLFLDKYLKQ